MARKRAQRKTQQSRPIAEPVLGSERRLQAFALLLLLLLPTVLLWSVTFGGKTLVPADALLVMSPWRHFARERFPDFDRVRAPLLDVVQQYYPWRKFYAETLRQGELPLWNPYMFCGTSFVGNGMSAIFYPLNLLFVVLPVDLAFGWMAWLHLVLAGLFLFGFLRRWLSPLAAVTGAVVFQLCGFFVAWLAYLPLLCTATWLPAALWAYETALEKPSPARLPLALLAALSLGMALLAGHPQVGFYVLWAFSVYFLARTLWHGASRMGRWHNALALGATSLLGGIAFGAAQLLPLLEMSQISFRSGADAFAAARENRLPIDQFVRLFIPAFFGDWRSGTHFMWDFARFNFVERTGYAGVVSFLLAVVGFGAGWLRRNGSPVPSGQASEASETFAPVNIRWLALMGGTFALFGILAAASPLVHRYMALGLPGTQAFVGISRALFLFDFGIAFLSAVGLFAIERQWADRRFVASLLGAALLIMAICVSIGVNAHAGTAFHPLLQEFTLHQIYRWLAFVTLGVFCVFAAVRLTGQFRRFVIALLPLLIAADLLLFAWGQNPQAERGMVFFETPSLRWLKQHLGDQRFVAVGTDAIKGWTPSNTLMVYGLRDAQGSDSLMTMRIFRFLQAWDVNSPLHRAFAVRNFASPLLDLMAVRYIVAAEPLPKNERVSLRLVHAGDLWVYENDGAFPRVWVADQLRWAKTPQDALRQVKIGKLNLRRTVVLERALWQPPTSVWGYVEVWQMKRRLGQPARKPTPAPSQERVRWREGVNRLTVFADLPRAGALVVADGAYPGWRAFVKERNEPKTVWRPLPVFVANYAFRAVLLPAGRHEVAWVYFPSSVAVGLFLSLSVVAATAATLMCWRPIRSP